MEYHVYDGVKIPIMQGTRKRDRDALYNLPQDEIDRMRCDTQFDAGECMESEGFRGVSMEEAGIPILDDKEIRERVEFQKAHRSSIYHVFRDIKVPCWNQNGHGYCWGYGTARTLLAAMVMETGKLIDLDPHPTCAYAKNGRDQGGWATEFIGAALKVGVAVAGMLPKHSRDPRGILKPEVQARVFKPQKEDIVNIRSGDMQAVRSLLVSNNACSLGRAWWGHMYADITLDWHDKHGWLYLGDNSHGGKFGANGVFWQPEHVARHGGGATIRVAA